MKVDRKVVQTVADLAKLRLEEADIEEYTSSMSRILDLALEMQAVDTEGVLPMAHPLDTVARLRPDEVTETDGRETYMAVAPDAEDGLYLVPRVVE